MDRIVLIVALSINLFGFLLMGHDKRRAKLAKWRVPEKNLWIVAMLGGAVGMLLGMRLFRHKTKHRSFKYGLPALALLDILAVVYYIAE